jgi:archaellum biogenesis ATPase FlaH
MNAQEFCDRLGGKRNGKGWMAKCPSHDDSKASLSINETQDGHVLIKCFAGCETKDILDKLGLTFADISPAKLMTGNGSRHIVATYDYRDTQERTRYQVVRFEPKDFRQRRPDGKGDWVWNVTGIEPLPYRLPELLKAIGLGKTVLIPEGEKDADTLTMLGLPATCNHGGAGKWYDSLNPYFTDADVVILPDNDEPGRKHAELVARSLARTARRIRILKLPDLPPKGDVSDWICAGHNVEDLLSLVEVAEGYIPQVEIVKRTYKFIDGHLLNTLPRVSWLIPGLLPEQGLTMVYGRSGVGKSFFVLHLAMALSLGIPVVYVATEGERGYLQRTAVWEKHYNTRMGNLTFCMGLVALLDPIQLDMFIEDLKRYKPRLIVVDTMAVTLLPGDENNTRDMGRFVVAAKRIMEECQTAVLLVHHTNKGGEMERGNVVLRANCDMIIRLNNDDDTILVECAKTKDGVEFETQKIKLLPVEVETPDGLLASTVIIDANQIVQRQEDPLTPRQKKILEALSETFPDGAYPQDLEAVVELTHGGVYKALAKLKTLGHIWQEAPKEPYLITAAGRDALQRPSTKATAAKVTGSPIPLIGGVARATPLISQESLKTPRLQDSGKTPARLQSFSHGDGQDSKNGQNHTITSGLPPTPRFEKSGNSRVLESWNPADNDEDGAATDESPDSISPESEGQEESRWSLGHTSTESQVNQDGYLPESSNYYEGGL